MQNVRNGSLTTRDNSRYGRATTAASIHISDSRMCAAVNELDFVESILYLYHLELLLECPETPLYSSTSLVESLWRLSDTIDKFIPADIFVLHVNHPI